MKKTNNLHYIPVPDRADRGRHDELFEMLRDSKGQAVAVPFENGKPNYNAASSMQIRFLRIGMKVHRHIDRDAQAMVIWVSPILGASQKLR